MTSTNFRSSEQLNVKTNPFESEKVNEKIKFIISDFRKGKDIDFLPINKLEAEQLEKNQLEENLIFGKKLFKHYKPKQVYYTKTQKWLGHITEITENGFHAILKDLSFGGTEEFGEFAQEEVTYDDRKLIKLGAAFYMSLGYFYNEGTVKKDSEIRFQRLTEFDENEGNNIGLELRSELINYFK